MKPIYALLVLCSLVVLAGCQPQQAEEEPLEDTNTTWVVPVDAVSAVF